MTHLSIGIQQHPLLSTLLSGNYKRSNIIFISRASLAEKSRQVNNLHPCLTLVLMLVLVRGVSVYLIPPPRLNVYRVAWFVCTCHVTPSTLCCPLDLLCDVPPTERPVPKRGDPIPAPHQRFHAGQHSYFSLPASKK